MLAVVRNVDLTEILGVVIVIGCLIGAAVYATRQAWIAVLCLILVAIVAAYLLL